MLVFDDDIGVALCKAREQERDRDSVILAHAAKIVRRNIYSSKPFTESFEENCQETSVPHLLLALVSMVLEGPSVKDQSHACSKQAALSIT